MAKRKQKTLVKTERRADWIDWTDIGKRKFSTEDRLRHVRLIGKPVVFWRYFVNGKSAIVTEGGNPIAAKYNILPSRRYAINVLDRSDGVLRVLQGTEELFVQFRWFSEETGIDPGGPDSCDFEIIKPHGNGTAKYKVVYDLNSRTPFSSAEKVMIAANFLDLGLVFRPTPAEKIEHRLGLTLDR